MVDFGGANLCLILSALVQWNLDQLYRLPEAYAVSLQGNEIEFGLGLR